MKKTSSLRMIKTSLVMFAAVAAMTFLAQTASAQSCGYGGGYGGYGGGYGGRGISIGFNTGYGGYGNSFNYRSFRPSYGGYGGGWHDTSHWDYHPGRFVPHGNHFDYVPGHYDFHRTGHRH